MKEIKKKRKENRRRVKHWVLVQTQKAVKERRERRDSANVKE